MVKRDGGSGAIGWLGLIAVLVAFLLAPSFVSVIFFGGQSERLFPDAQAGLKVAWVHAVGLVIALAAIAIKKWWRDVFTDVFPARRWLWMMPLSVIALSAAMADYDRMGTAGAAAVAALALGTLMIALSEELMFRGVLMTFLRQRHGELTVAIVSSVLFGLVHFLAGPVQVLFSAFLGFVLYFAKRVSGGLLVPVLVHFAWDFAVFTSFMTSDPAEGSDASLALALLNVILVVLGAVLWKKVSPPPRA